MRIITGTARGTHLETLPGLTTRPTSERVKEALFSMIQFDIEGREVLDLFAGSGQLGLEALSRGAVRATFTDSSSEAVTIIKRNAQKTHLYEKCRISCTDWRNAVKSFTGKEKFGIIFIDPPYGKAGDYGKAGETPSGKTGEKDTVDVGEVLEKIEGAGIAAEHAMIIIESRSKSPITAQSFKLLRHTRYGSTFITLLTNDTESDI